MQTPNAIKHTELVYPNHTIVQATFSLWDDYEAASTPESVLLALRFGSREIATCNGTYWEACCTVRAELDQENILICCYGSSRNVYPSGMCLSMGVGDLAYRIQTGQPARTADLVNIFDTGPDVDPAMLADQKDFQTKWLNSLTQP